jgi:hypothetical protein
VYRRTSGLSVDYLLASIKPAQLPDVLMLLAWHAAHEAEQAAADAAIALIEHDRYTCTCYTASQTLAAAAAMAARQVLMWMRSARRAAAACRAGMSRGDRRPARLQPTSSSSS